MMLLLVTHGIAGGPGAAAGLAPLLQRSGRFAAVGIGCHKAAPDLDTALASLPPGPVVAAPLLMAEGWIHAAVRRRLADHPRARDLALAPALGTHPELWRLVLARAVGVCEGAGWAPRATTLLLAGHGTPRHAGAAASTLAAAARIAARGCFARVRTGFLDQPPRLADVARGIGDGPCVAVGFFVDNGPHGRDDVRTALAAASRPIRYAGAVAADALVVPYLLEQTAAARPLQQQALSPA
jgi:hypothetical protein